MSIDSRDQAEAAFLMLAQKIDALKDAMPKAHSETAHLKCTEAQDALAAILADANPVIDDDEVPAQAISLSPEPARAVIPPSEASPSETPSVGQTI